MSRRLGARMAKMSRAERLERAVEMYRSGASQTQVNMKTGISFPRLRRELLSRGIAIRTAAETQKATAARVRARAVEIPGRQYMYDQYYARK